VTYKVIQWANTTKIVGIIIEGLFMNSQNIIIAVKQCDNSATPLKSKNVALVTYKLRHNLLRRWPKIILVN